MSLDEITTSELIDELSRRCKSFALSMMPHADQRSPGVSSAVIRWDGSFYEALGLASMLHASMLADATEGREAEADD